jgi:hypothetical protein
MLTRRILPVVVVALLVGNVIALAALPSGERELADVVPENGKILVSRTLGKVRILLVGRGNALRLVVAYHQDDRWHSVKVEPAPAGSHAAWAATEGAGPVPAFSAVYGLAPGDKVVVRWADGKTTDLVPVEGAYLAIRRGQFRPEGVDLNPPATTTTVAPATTAPPP